MIYMVRIDNVLWKPRHALLLSLSAFLFCAFGAASALAQDAGSPAEPALNPREAVDAAVKLLDGLEEQGDGETPRDQLEEVDRIIVALERAEPTNPWIPYLYGRAYALMGRNGDAIDELQKFVKTREGKNEWKAFRMLGELFVDEFPRLAQAKYKRAAQLKAGEPTVLYGLSVCAFKLGDQPTALHLAEQAVNAGDGEDVGIVSHLARMHIASEQWVQADRSTTRALDLARRLASEQPGERKPLEVLSEQYRLAIDVLEARGSATGTTADDFLRLAELIRARSEVAAKLALYDVLAVLELGVETTEPNTPPALLQEYAAALAEVGRTDRAVEVFERLLTLDPSNTTAKEWLAQLKPQPPSDDASLKP